MQFSGHGANMRTGEGETHMHSSDNLITTPVTINGEEEGVGIRPTRLLHLHPSSVLFARLCGNVNNAEHSRGEQARTGPGERRNNGGESCRGGSSLHWCAGDGR